MWALALGWILTAPFVGYGFWAVYARSRTDGMAWAVLMVPMMATLAMGVVFYGSHRFRDALAPLFLVVAAYGVAPLTGYFARSGDRGSGSAPPAGAARPRSRR